MPDKQNFNCVVGFHLLQDPITDENKTPCLSAGSSTGEASLGVCEEQSQAQYIVRRLTPLECERLQGFPDGWTDIGEWTDSKGSCVWASEIEDFPIAVTKYHFPEEVNNDG